MPTRYSRSNTNSKQTLTINEVYVAIMEQFPHSSDTAEHYSYPTPEYIPTSFDERTEVDLHASSLGTAEAGRARADIEVATMSPEVIVPRHERIAGVSRLIVELRRSAALGQEPASLNERSASDYTLAA